MARKLGINQSTYSHIETGNRSNITMAQLQTLVKEFGVSPFYILDGSSAMFSSPVADATEKTVSAATLPEHDTVTRLAKPASRAYLLVPVSARASYGNSWPEKFNGEDDAPQYVVIPGLGNDGRVFEINGESMMPHLLHGDLVGCTYVEAGADIKDGVIYILSSKETGLAAKYLRVSKRGMVCMSENNMDHADYLVPFDDIQEIWEVRFKVTKQLTAGRLYYRSAAIESRRKT